MKSVSDLTNTVGVADLSEDEVDSGTFVTNEVLRQALDIADTLGWLEFDVGTTWGDRSEDEADDPVLVLRKSENASAGIVVAPRLRGDSE